jgi:hypothetical protein
MYADDVKRLSSPNLWARYQALANADYKGRLQEALADKAGVGAWVEANTRVCSQCCLMVERSAGCNTMRCVCGFVFNWEQSAGPERFLATAAAAAGGNENRGLPRPITA